MKQRIESLDLFRTRLAILLDEDGRSQSAFATAVGVDRSTISQLLSKENHRLPRVETLMALTGESGASIDWLLGRSNEGAVGTDILREELTLGRNELSPLDEALIGWFEESIGMRVRYVPSTIPDLIKTDAVIRHEFARSATATAEQKIEIAGAPLGAARAPGSDMDCCNSIQSLEGFARGEGIWQSLPVTQRLEQLDQMIALSDELYPSFRWYLFDSRQQYGAAMTVFGLQRVVLYLGQTYLVLTGREHLLAFIDQFDELIRGAVVQPPEVPTFLRSLRSEIS